MNISTVCLLAPSKTRRRCPYRDSKQAPSSCMPEIKYVSLGGHSASKERAEQFSKRITTWLCILHRRMLYWKPFARRSPRSSNINRLHWEVWLQNNRLDFPTFSLTVTEHLGNLEAYIRPSSGLLLFLAYSTRMLSKRAVSLLCLSSKKTSKVVRNFLLKHRNPQSIEKCSDLPLINYQIALWFLSNLPNIIITAYKT